MTTLAQTLPRARSSSRRTARWRAFVGTGLPLLAAVLVALPLVLVFVNSFNTAAPGQPAHYGIDNWISAFTDPKALAALWNSVALSVTRTGISLALAIALAWLIARSDMPGRGAVEWLCWIGVFLPVLPRVFGWILLLDAHFGLVNQALQSLPFVRSAPFDVYGFWGIVWVQVASTSVYIQTVLLIPAFGRVGAALEEAASISGASRFTTIRRVTVPLLAPAVIGVAILALVRALESFEVELLLGQPIGLEVYSTRIYNLIRALTPQYGQATALGFLFLVVLVGLAVLNQWYLRGKQFTTVSGHSFSTARVRLGPRKWLISAVCFAYLGIALVAPMILLVLGSFMRRYGFFNIAQPFTLDHWKNVLTDPVFVPSLRNSLLISIGASAIVIVVYSLIAHSVVRATSRWARVTDLLLWVPWALPGVLLSLGLLWLFLGTPLRTVLYGTLPGIIIALAMKEAPSAMLFFKAGFHQIGQELEECARMTGASWFYTYRRVLLPLVAPTAITVGILAFLSSMTDISTTVLLYTPPSRPLSILMLEYSFGGQMEDGTAAGVLITLIVLVALVLARRLGFHLAREDA